MFTVGGQDSSCGSIVGIPKPRKTTSDAPSAYTQVGGNAGLREKTAIVDFAVSQLLKSTQIRRGKRIKLMEKNSKLM